VNAGRAAFEAAIRGLGNFVARWPEAVRSLITGRFPMESCMIPIQGGGDGIKSVIMIGEGAARPARSVVPAKTTSRASKATARAPRRKPARTPARRPRTR
jgi:hypothetical protein